MHKDYCQTYVQQHDESHQDGVRALWKHRQAHTLKSVGGLSEKLPKHQSSHTKEAFTGNQGGNDSVVSAQTPARVRRPLSEKEPVKESNSPVLPL